MTDPRPHRLRPVPQFDGSLPIHAAEAEILALLSAHPVLILSGETGSGKTTQMPKYCLLAGRGERGLIGCTQPRRIAARSVAARLAQELKVEMGQAVGYKVRFHDRISDATVLKVMTDGILLAEIHHDPKLLAYDTLIVDEAHERSLNIDFLLGYLKRLLPRRPDLKLIITSATMETERLSRHFDGAPIIEVSGRTYPVEVRWRPLGEAEGDAEPRDWRAGVLDAVDELVHDLPQGDVLVFLPGEREIREAAESLRKHHPPHTEILPLFSRLSFTDQDRVFKPGTGRRIVLATNVAETSLTVPGIRSVVDTGLARINRYSLRNKVTQLQVEKISQASVRQRAGRCGRVAAGICIRLYDETDYDGRPAYTTPEILRTSLAAVILRMEALGLGQVEEFPFLDPPSPRAVEDGYRLLDELGALDVHRNLTTIGRELAKLPIDPRIGRMLLAARQQACLTEMLVIAAFLSVQDPRDQPFEQRQAAAEKHARFKDDQSEFLSILKLWAFVEEAVAHKKSNRKLDEIFRAQFLSPLRLREWREVHGQLHALVSEMGFKCHATPGTYEQIHRALLTGLLGQVGNRDPEADHYQGPRGTRFWIHPGSLLAKTKARWLVAGELSETTRLFARLVAKVEPEWIEAAGARLVKRTYHDPTWDEASAQANAFEKVTLFGLTLVSRRRVRYGPIDPAAARELFIRHALVLGAFRCNAPFFRHNRELVAEVEALEHKSRRQDVLVDESALASFFEARIPAGIWSGERFEKWRREAERDDPRLLFLSREQLMRHGAEHVTETLFPETLALGELSLPLRYRFEPGHPLDGVTLTVPLLQLNQLDPAQLEWLVPGLIRDKITLLLKQLPQRLRRDLVPLPAFVTAFLTQQDPTSGSLLQALSKAVKARCGEAVPREAFGALPPHLEMTIRVVDDAGKELASGKSLDELRRELGQLARAGLQDSPTNALARTGLRTWDFGDLPASVPLKQAGRGLIAYPALVDEGDSVAIRLIESEAEAQRLMGPGLERLCWLALQPQLKALGKSIPGFDTLALSFGLLPDSVEPGQSPAETLRHDLLTRALWEFFPAAPETVRSAAQFDALRDQIRAGVGPKLAELATILQQTFKSARELLQQFEAVRHPSQQKALPALRLQFAALCQRHFIAGTPISQLRHYPRYLQAMRLRLDKIAQDPAGDDSKAAQIAALEQPWKARQAVAADTPEWQGFRWLLEELRVSLFAQQLKTPQPVSVKRLEKRWQEISATMPR